MVIRPRKLDFRVQYRVKKEDIAITMRCRTESMEELHKILCGMHGFKIPLGNWHELIIHETLLDGSVADIPKEHLAREFDWKYGFEKEKEPATEDKGKGFSALFTVVNLKGFGERPKQLSTAHWWKEYANVL